MKKIGHNLLQVLYILPAKLVLIGIPVLIFMLTVSLGELFSKVSGEQADVLGVAAFLALVPGCLGSVLFLLRRE
ncbi:MAG: hypothetical protein IJ390_14330 [Lachnospiraceae bacterium]|nr:hypothetical protein [Lachnospiraceae bacterium]